MKQQIMLLLNPTNQGSTFKLVDLMVILEDKVADTMVYDTNGGEIRYSGKAVRDSRGDMENIFG
jgi:hypothetical protein